MCVNPLLIFSALVFLSRAYNRVFLSPCFNCLLHFCEGPTPEPPPPKPCKEHLDVGVIIDSSNSISEPDYRSARQYIKLLAERLQISEAGTHMAILLYSWEAHTWHRLVDEAAELRPLGYILLLSLSLSLALSLSFLLLYLTISS